MRAYPFLILFIVPGLLIVGLMVGGALTFAVPVFVFVLVPIADRLFGEATRNPERPRGESAGGAHLALLVVYAAIELAVTVWTLLWIGEGSRYETGAIIGLILGLGIQNGAIGITVAHECIHRSSRVERALGVALLLCALYPHFRIEHVQGHHANVATPHDPATARRGQNVYMFWLQSVRGSVASAWAIERRRLSRMNKPLVSLNNRMLAYVLSIVLIVVVLSLYSLASVLAFLVQALVAFSLLEVVNYVEHYGLSRASDGRRYERVGVAHSWDTPRRLTNYLLINLQRHADHHVSPLQRYQWLHHTSSAPQLPAGYAEMVLTALVPPLWFRRMDHRIDAYLNRG